jgi:hypothetical protein
MQKGTALKLFSSLVKKYYNVVTSLLYSSKPMLYHPRNNRVAIVDENNFSLSLILKNFNFLKYSIMLFNRHHYLSVLHAFSPPFGIGGFKFNDP